METTTKNLEKTATDLEFNCEEFGKCEKFGRISGGIGNIRWKNYEKFGALKNKSLNSSDKTAKNLEIWKNL